MISKVSKHRALAQTIAERLFQEPGVLAVVLIGSVARGTVSEDSDVDLAVFIDNYCGPFLEMESYEGTRVGIERYSASEALRTISTISVPLLDFRLFETLVDSFRATSCIRAGQGLRS